jgi:excisionase family DNA binding protein
LTIPEVAELLGTGPKLVRSWIASGALKAIDFSSGPATTRRRWRVTPQALDEFLAPRS